MTQSWSWPLTETEDGPLAKCAYAPLRCEKQPLPENQLQTPLKVYWSLRIAASYEHKGTFKVNHRGLIKKKSKKHFELIIK